MVWNRWLVIEYGYGMYSLSKLKVSHFELKEQAEQYVALRKVEASDCKIEIIKLFGNPVSTSESGSDKP